MRGEITPAEARPLAPPRAAVVAGVIFSVLMATTVVIVRLSVPSYPAEWPNNPIRRNTVRFGIQLAPFAGIAFLSTVTLRTGILPRWVGLLG